jgi:hypothetical protein
MVGESCPTVLAAGPIARECTTSVEIGLDVEEGASFTSSCGCGHPLAARSVESLWQSFKAHVRYRRAQ